MAVSDFCAVNSHYTTRIVLHTRDFEGEPLHALSAALDLLQTDKVQAITSLETSNEAKFLVLLGDKAKIPILSLTISHLSSTKYHYFVQVAQDGTTQFKGIATILESVIFVYEDIDNGREIISYFDESFQEKSIHIAYRSVISPTATDNDIIKELYKHRTTQTTIFIVHMSLSLASRLFLNVKRLGMMSNRYAWIMTGTTMKLLHSMDSEGIESLQGALGFKSYIPSSSELHNFNIRWKNGFYIKNPAMEVKDLNVDQGMGASLLDLANISVSQSGTTLLNEILQIKFRGLSGEFQILNGTMISKKFDAALGDITITDNRSRYVAFIMPYTDLGVGMITRKPIRDKNMWIFLKPLDANLWFTSGAFFILTSFVVWVNEDFQGISIASNLNFKDDRLEPCFSPNDYTNALSKGSKNGGVAAIVDELPYVKIFLANAKYSADYAMFASEPLTNGFGFVTFSKGSPLVSEISRAIAKLREDGKLEKMEKTWFNTQSSFMPHGSETNPNVLNLDSLRGLFLLSGISSVLALLIFLVFFLNERFCVKNHVLKAQGKVLFMMKNLFSRIAIMIRENNAR
ncbi:unnamed protein product [Ilex paraguariensis]|uniref:Ionotropic glutamate receptor C-terminal domain-containing protein n=1 Tax=Ilex paraguariensis TaxID=185542 RepID=A0ABC8RDA7_9AQUA